ncbi:MAG: hypothetical protein KDA33_14335 [Phycisphaerales bacterium]|nr:hypothetical protein [Phycisphaerales bacterium]
MSIDAKTPSILLRLTTDVAAAAQYLFSRHDTPPGSPAPAPRSVWPMVPIGLLIGLVWTGVFRLTWRVFGEIGSLRLLPSFAVVVVFATLTGHRTLQAAIRLVEAPADAQQPRNGQARVGEKSLILLILSLLGMFVLVLSLQEIQGWWPAADDWRSWFNWMYPRPIYRPLLLAPLWGHWGMLVALCAGRAAPHADPLTRNYVRGLNVWKLVVHSAAPLFLTSVYLSRDGRFFTGPMMVATLLAATILFATIVANLRGGQCRSSVLTTGLFAQTLFLVLYRAFWPLIER